MTLYIISFILTTLLPYGSNNIHKALNTKKKKHEYNI